jgi:hypothetical protein
MQKNKFGFRHQFCPSTLLRTVSLSNRVLRLILVLVAGLCMNAWASDDHMSSQQKLNLEKISRLLPKEARISLLRDLRVSEEARQSDKAAAGTGAIHGRVTQTAGGAPIAGVMVWANLQDCPSYSSLAMTGSDGYYTVTGLPVGWYKVWTSNNSNFVDIYWDNKPADETADTVHVASNDTAKGIDFSLRVGGKITGTVTMPGADSVTGIVYAIDPAYTRAYYAYVYGMGSSSPYEIKRLPTGTYKLRTGNAVDYIDVYYDDKSSWATADLVSVTEGATSSSKDFTLNLGGTIEGNVSSTSKEPLEDVDVWGYYAPSPEWSSQTFTDENGDYALTGLRSGYWKIFVKGDDTYVFEWYHDKGTWTAADSLLVTAPGTYSDKDFALETGGSISGHVYDLGELPLSGCDVTAYESSFFEWGIAEKSATSSATGAYQITGLRTGDYKVEASTQCYSIWYDNQTSPATASLVHVTMPYDTSGIDFHLPSTAVETEDEIAQRPAEFELHQNYPNPFNPLTRIEYTLKKRGHVALHIYNILGEKVRTLLDQDQPAGFHQISWDGENDQGKAVSSGLYLYKLEVDGFSQAKTMLLLK